LIELEKVCVFHHVKITTPEIELQHMGPMCIIYTTGSEGLGSVEPIGQAPAIFESEMTYEGPTEELVMPYATKTPPKKEVPK
jgi:hypothetical protein